MRYLTRYLGLALIALAILATALSGGLNTPQEVVALASWLIIGAALSPLWRLITRATWPAPWVWYHWINASALLALWAFSLWLMLILLFIDSPLFRTGAVIG